jgi:hypothetical protein
VHPRRLVRRDGSWRVCRLGGQGVRLTGLTDGSATLRRTFRRFAAITMAGDQ